MLPEYCRGFGWCRDRWLAEDGMLQLWTPCCQDGTEVYLVQKSTRKRFYRKTDILRGEGKFEIRLDQRKLKTPRGVPLRLDSEPLALAVAAEWDSQQPNITQATMHLTSLCNTALDNPNNLTKYDIANYLVNYVATDTLLYYSSEEDELYQFQQEKWLPVLRWFCERFQVQLDTSRGFDTPVISAHTRAVLSRHILSYDFAAANALMFGVDALKSLVLMVACVECFLTPEQAVLLCRLEEEFQVGHWGRVEWAHEVAQQELQARVAAALLIVQCCQRSHTTRAKQDARDTQHTL